MRKVYFITVILLATAKILPAQSVPQNTYLNNYVQPSPNVAALGEYVNFPVSYYTGVPEINIPIYDLKDGAVNVPISLSYHASGIRVSEVASWVGLGWALNAGGMITRTVRGAPDEGSTKVYNAPGPRGYYRDSGLSKLPLLPYPVGGQVSSDPSQLAMQLYTIPAVAAGAIDGEPDLFFFNFNGYMGKFVFDENRTPRLLTDADLKIAVNYSNGQFASWIITTPDGVKYYFGENNMHEVTLPHSIQSGDDPDSQLPSSWFLTRIVYPNTNDTVYFNYTPETSTYFDLGPESVLYNFINGSKSDFIQNVCDNSMIKQNIIRTTVEGLRLTSIQSRNYTVQFIADTPRQDLSNYTSQPNRLDSIKIFNNGQCVKQFAFQYTYFVSSPATGFLDLNNPSMYVDSSDRRRLKLLSVKEISGDGTLSKPPYIFGYQDTFSLPRRISYDQDNWGYSNFAAGNHNPYFMPLINYPPACTGVAGADRSPNWPQMEAGTLISIKNPLGVLTTFQFEPNSANNAMVGGLRIQQITALDSVTGRSTVRRFQYAQGGVLFRTPKYVIKLQNEFYVLPTLNGLSGYQGYSYSPVIIGILKQSQSIVPLQDAQGNQIGYGTVREIFGANGEGGYKEYHFDVDMSPTDNSRLSLNNYASLQSVNTIFDGTTTTLMGNGHFNDILPQNLQYYTGYDVDNYYPAAPYQINLMRGKLLSENVYDSSGALIKSIQNTYQPAYHENFWIRGFKVYRIPMYQSTSGDTGYVPPYANALTYYKLHTGIAHLVSSTETDYKDGKVFTVTHHYGYESPNHTLQTSDTTVNSQGDSIVTKTYYSFDYANNATPDGVFAKMKSRNLLLPVSSQEWKNGQLLSGRITQYQDFAASSPDTFINPSKIYVLETTTPLTLTQSGESYSFPNQIGTLLPNSYFQEKADFNFNGTTGKIIEQRLTNNKNQALIWDNNYSLPLAQVDNANFTDVAYSSFESAEMGNWSYSNTSVVTDSSAPTGTHAYALGSTAISKTGLNSATQYVLSYWLKAGANAVVSGGTQSNPLTGNTQNGWTYHEVTLNGTSSVSISGNGNIDELRLYPSDAQMTSYTYDSLLRLTATDSPNSTITYYEYDALNRLVDIKDQYGNIIKAFEYNYGQSAR